MSGFVLRCGRALALWQREELLHRHCGVHGWNEASYRLSVAEESERADNVPEFDGAGAELNFTVRRQADAHD